jgi:hypothetical protein
MRALGLSRLLAVAIIATLALSVLGAVSPAKAELARGSVMIHSRVCPLNLPAGSMLFDDCHSHPGPSGAEFTVDNRAPKAIGANGNVSFGRVTAGDHLVTLTADWQPNEFLGMRAFCSNSVGGSGVHEATILRGDQAQFWVRVGAGSQLTCDLYFIPSSGR